MAGSAAARATDMVSRNRRQHVLRGHPFRLPASLLSRLGYTPFESGVVISIVALAYLLVQPAAGRIADVTDAATTIKIGLVISALSVIAAPFTQGNLLVLLSIAAGVGVGTVWTNSDLLVSKLAKEGRMGATMGVAGSFKEFGDMVGPLLIGALSQWLGLTAGFVICGVLGLMSLILVFGEGQRRGDQGH